MKPFSLQAHGMFFATLLACVQADASKPKIELVTPPTEIRTIVRLQPEGRLQVGDLLTVECEATPAGAIENASLQLNFNQSVAAPQTVERLVVVEPSKPAVTAGNRPADYIGNLVANRPIKLILRFRAARCGPLNVYFGYSYYVGPKGKIAQAAEVVLARCIAPATLRGAPATQPEDAQRNGEGRPPGLRAVAERMVSPSGDTTAVPEVPEPEHDDVAQEPVQPDSCACEGRNGGGTRPKGTKRDSGDPEMLNVDGHPRLSSDPLGFYDEESDCDVPDIDSWEDAGGP